MVENSSGNRKRIVVSAIIGLFVAIMAIWVVNNVYDPFAEDIEELLIFVPEDADFVVYSADFPNFDQGLGRSPLFQRPRPQPKLPALLGQRESRQDPDRAKFGRAVIANCESMMLFCR